MRRERPPVDQQGRSPRYVQGMGSPPPEPLSDASAALVWTGVVVLVAAYAILTSVPLLDPAFPKTFASIILLTWFAVLAALRPRAHRRPYPSVGQKVLAVASILGAMLWLFALVIWADQLRNPSSVAVILITSVSWALVMGAVVLNYRARFFSWWNAERSTPATPSGTGGGDG